MSWRRIHQWANLQFTVIGWPKNIGMYLHELSTHSDGFFLRLQIENGEAAD